jgi:hypothetical protein
MDTVSCAHIYANMQALVDRRHLKKGEVTSKVGNSVSISAMPIGSISLHLASGLIINLNNTYYVSSICKNIIFVSCLNKNEYVFIILNSCMSILKNDFFYGNANVNDDLYLLEVNNKYILNVNNK